MKRTVNISAEDNIKLLYLLYMKTLWESFGGLSIVSEYAAKLQAADADLKVFTQELFAKYDATELQFGGDGLVTISSYSRDTQRVICLLEAPERPNSVSIQPHNL